MQRYFIYLSYDGTRYHGWQVQPSANTVQQELQQALSTILRSSMEVVGAGRTDTGVHARQMVAHFDWDDANGFLPFTTYDLTYKLNRLLPCDIAISKIESVPSEAHARFSAISRTYHYYIHTSKQPFIRSYSCELHYNLDFPLMNEAAAYLLKVDDFAAFCKTHTDVKTTLCQVKEAKWINDGDDKWHFRISANRFLRNMVRAVVGTLIDVGRHRITLEDFQRIVAGKKRTEAGESMPAKALFLESVDYE